MSLDDVIVSRTALRDEYRKALVAAAEDRFAEADGSWDGVPALTRPAFDAALAEIFDRPVPLPPDTHAEVSTPSSILVAAICPKCDLPTTILVSIHPELVVDDEGSEIRVKTKAKARSHSCGQQELPLGGSTVETTGLEQETLPFAEPIVNAEELLVLLGLVRGIFDDDDVLPTEEEINGWTEPVREQVRAFASTVYNLPGGAAEWLNRDPEDPPLPRVLGGEADPPAPAGDDVPTDTPLGLEDDQAGEEGDPE